MTQWGTYQLRLRPGRVSPSIDECWRNSVIGGDNPGGGGGGAGAGAAAAVGAVTLLEGVAARQPAEGATAWGTLRQGCLSSGR